MSIFVIGSNGYIAKRIIKSFSPKYQTVLVSSNPKSDELYLNLTNPEEFNYDILKSDDTVLFMAAVSSPDACRQQYDYSYSVNVSGASCFIDKCLGKNSKVIYFSSDTVYGDLDKCFDEESSCMPKGVYARMKHSVENKFIGDKNFKTLRLSYVFSREDKFTVYLADCVVKSRVAEIYDPFYRKVVYIEDLISAVELLCLNWNRWNNSIFNISGPDLLSREMLAQLYSCTVSKELKYRIVDPGDIFFEERPRKINMVSLYLTDLIKSNPHSIQKAMEMEFRSNN